MTHVKVVKRANGRTTYVGRYRAPDGRWHQTSGHGTAADAQAAAEQAQHEGEGAAYAVREDDYFVGRYRTPGGRWLETEHGFHSAEDALAEAGELEQAARAAASPDA
jgi:hypothetical protein